MNQVTSTTPGVLPPGRAPVTPRGRCLPGGEVLPVEDLVRPWIEAGAHGIIAIKGGPDSGRSTALEHLLATFGASEDLVFLDDPAPAEVEAHAGRALVISTTNRPAPESRLATIALAGWGDDDAIEYLLARHRDKCSSVMKRLLADAERTALLGGSPHLWSVALEEMAADDSLREVATALRRRVKCLLPDSVEYTRLGNRSLRSLERELTGAAQPPPQDSGSGTSRLFRHRSVRLLLAAEALVTDLQWGNYDSCLTSQLPREFLHRVAQIAGSDPAVPASLAGLMSSRLRRVHASAASLMLALDPDWRPSDKLLPRMNGAVLTDAKWAWLDLCGAELQGTDLRRADLSGTNLAQAQLRDADLRDARLMAAHLEEADALHAHLGGANLSRARLDRARLRLASLSGANLTESSLVDVMLTEADLSGARLFGANCSRATLRRARLDGADLTNANLSDVDASECDFKKAILIWTSFENADLHSSDFEGVEITAPDFEEADLTGAYMTGSVLPRARFKGAILAEAALADIEWEDADLRDADFTNASFHMGSSRSGLVGSPIASEGSRTGFYTDESLEDGFKAPEDVRKANLRGADLRGAKVAGTDWYLVDLRGAKFTPDQEVHFRKCRAILDDRMS